ncbi:hypothetical protein QFZ35_003136 [Arthrobacter ulcerisalmonis]|nr:hypothetical protein [Arthrobacter ulcerisalmonis]MDQ0664638.1 hypothetical protein [Arthrobacter ulcerisalmonis]
MPRFSASGELEEIEETALLVRENLGEEARSEVASILVKSVQSLSYEKPYAALEGARSALNPWCDGREGTGETSAQTDRLTDDAAKPTQMLVASPLDSSELDLAVPSSCLGVDALVPRAAW